MNPKGCSFLDQGIDFELDKVCDCCISHNGWRGLPLLLENYHGELIDWENLFKIKAKRIEAQKQATIYDCDGCYHLTDYTFKEEKKISEFHFTHCRLCNAKCIYCSKEYSEGSINYDVYPIIKDLIDKGYYKGGGEATMEGGEPTLMQHFDELVHLLTSNGTNIRVHTSGIKFSPTVAEALKNNKGKIVVSIDSGTSKTYKNIKQIDAFQKVCSNIEQYYSVTTNHPENIVIKYIIIPGFNDNIKEIKNFFKLIKSLKITTVALDIELQYARNLENKNLSPHIYFLVDYFENLAKKYNMQLLKYSFLSYVLNNRTIEKAKYLNNDILFNFRIKKFIQKEKNINYTR